MHILGTDRHESRRIDNQLRGRSGRQGDPGYSKFFLSLEDDLLRLFISDSRRSLFERIGMGDDHIEHKMLSRGIENAQKRIESRNFDIRKNLLEYDDVANDQRQAIYSLRNQLLNEDNISEAVNDLIDEEMRAVSNDFVPLDSVESQWRLEELDRYLIDHYFIEANVATKVRSDKKLTPDSIATLIADNAAKKYKEKYLKIGDNLAQLEKQVMLQILDVHWKDHLSEMDHLRQSVGLRAYAQKNTKNEFKQEAYSMFESMLDAIDSETVRALFSIDIVSKDQLEAIKKKEKEDVEMVLEKAEASAVEENTNNENINSGTIKREDVKVGRNEIISITNGTETKEMKYKKAKPLIDSGEWRIS